MKRLSLEKERITIDYSSEQIPESVRNFRPDVYRDGGEYCLILGNDEHAVVGCAASIEEAMNRWDEAYWKKRYSSGNK